jgi:hypothetical protein
MKMLRLELEPSAFHKTRRPAIQRRRYQQQNAIRLEDAVHMREKLDWITRMLDHIGAYAYIEAALGKSRMLDSRTADSLPTQEGVDPLHGVPRHIQAAHLKSLPRGLVQKLTIATPHIQQFALPSTLISR